MRVILTLALLYTVSLQAQQIKLTPLPDVVKENRIGEMWQASNGSYVGKGGKAFGQSTYFKLDKSLNVTALGQWDKKTPMWPQTTLEFGSTFYEFGINYVGKENRLQFAVSDFNSINTVKYYHTETYSWKVNGNYNQYYAIAISRDKQKLALIWLDPATKTKFTIYEFDQNFNKTNENTFNVEVPVEDINELNFAQAQLDNRNNVVLILDAHKYMKTWLVKLSLNDKKSAIKLLQHCDGHEDISDITLDNNRGMLYYLTHVKNPTGSYGVLNLDGAATSLDFSQSIATLYSVNLETFQAENVPIKVTSEEEALIRAKEVGKPSDKQLPNGFYIKDEQINVFSSGNCAVTISFGCRWNGANNLTADVYTNALLRVYSTDLRKVAAKTLNVERQYADKAERLIRDNELYYFASFRVHLRSQSDVTKKGCYKISDTGEVKAYYPDETDINISVPYLADQRITTGKILVSGNNSLYWLECD